jgi:AcrR family transcriptional regulator
VAAAERFIDRHGIHKTTIDDIASEVGLSCPSIYRYFADRDNLLIDLIARHARALLDRARKSMSRKSTFRIRSSRAFSTSPTTAAATP